MTVSLEHAQAHLVELIAGLHPGESLTITRNDNPVARLSTPPQPTVLSRKAGLFKGMIQVVAEGDERFDDWIASSKRTM
ncbi:MAG: hypothetical protein QM811_09765 [Pirellulales bacterium]